VSAAPLSYEELKDALTEMRKMLEITLPFGEIIPLPHLPSEVVTLTPEGCRDSPLIDCTGAFSSSPFSSGDEVNSLSQVASRAISLSSQENSIHQPSASDTVSLTSSSKVPPALKADSALKETTHGRTSAFHDTILVGTRTPVDRAEFEISSWEPKFINAPGMLSTSSEEVTTAMISPPREAIAHGSNSSIAKTIVPSTIQAQPISTPSVSEEAVGHGLELKQEMMSIVDGENTPESNVTCRHEMIPEIKGDSVGDYLPIFPSPQVMPRMTHSPENHFTPDLPSNEEGSSVRSQSTESFGAESALEIPSERITPLVSLKPAGFLLQKDMSIINPPVKRKRGRPFKIRPVTEQGGAPTVPEAFGKNLLTGSNPTSNKPCPHNTLGERFSCKLTYFMKKTFKG
jgi:hypothetical protein